jgi:diketogulonate reductase-like aldo/keto reductase
LIHQPYFAKSPSDISKAWAELEKIQASGRAKSIGVSNFLPKDLAPILESGKVVPSINQIEFHPYLQHPALVELHKKHGIATAAYGPLSAVTKAKPGPVDPVIEKLTKKYGKSVNEVSLRWVLDQGIVAVTTSGKEERLKEYLGTVGWELAPEDVKTLSEEGSKKGYRGFWQVKFKDDDFE